MHDAGCRAGRFTGNSALSLYRPPMRRGDVGLNTGRVAAGPPGPSCTSVSAAAQRASRRCASPVVQSVDTGYPRAAYRDSALRDIGMPLEDRPSDRTGVTDWLR
jgi:hypothetical protein